MKLPHTISTRAWFGGAGALAAIGVLSLAACGGGSKSAASTVTVQGDVPIAYAKRVNTIALNPTNSGPSADGGDLMIREKASPSAPEHNMTAQFTMGKGDVQTPEVSWDGKKILFSMRCNSGNAVTIGGAPACTGHWNIWEYDMTTGGLTGGTFRRVTSSTGDDDIHPVYLPAGQGIVFTSNRQTESMPNQALGHSYYALTNTSANACPTCTRWRWMAATSRRSRSTRATTAIPSSDRTGRSCSRAGTTSAGATTSRSSRSTRTAPTCSCCTARTATATASCIRATWIRAASTPAS